MITHDIADSVQPRDNFGRNIECFCNITNNSLCMVLPTTADDTIDLDQACMAMPRTSTTSLNWLCQNSFMEQINRITSWLDMTQIYRMYSIFI